MIVAEDRELQKTIFDAGFAGIRYPKEYGGQGLTREHQLAWHQATAGYRVPTAFTVTHGIIGPTMLDFGTEEQKARHIPAHAGWPGAVGAVPVRAERGV